MRSVIISALLPLPAAVILWASALFAQVTGPDPGPDPAPIVAKTQATVAVVKTPAIASDAKTQPDNPRPNNPQADGLAIRLYARGEYAAVIERLEPAFKAPAKPLPIQERLLLARAFLHLDKNADGKAVLESVLKSDSENPDANFLMGQLLAGAGAEDGPAHNAGSGERAAGPARRAATTQAVEFLQHAAKLKKTPATDSLLGQCYFRLGEMGKAKEHLAAALKEDIRNPANSFLLGKIWLAAGSGAQAERFLLMAQEAGLDTVELHHLLGQAYLLEKKYVGPVMVKRIPTSQKAGDIVDDSVVLGKVEGAADQYKVCTRYCALYEGLKLSKDLWETQRRKGRAELPTSPPAKRQPPIMLPESKVDGLYMLAEGWFGAGEFDSSYAALDGLLGVVTVRHQGGKEITYEPAGSKRVLGLAVRLAIANKDFGSTKSALADAQEDGIFDPPTVADFYYQAAISLRADGKRAEALAMLKKADAAVPTSASVLRALAALSVATDQLNEARQYYTRIVELFPDATDIDELRNILRNLTEKTGAGHATTVPDEE